MKSGIGIGWIPNTDFYGVDNQTLFGDIFYPLGTIQQGVEDDTINNSQLEALKTQ